jgi:hypothetical protein
MATFYDIYQNYLKNPYGGINALPGVNAISGTMGATPISSMSGGDGVGEVSSVSPVGNVDNVGNVGGFGNLDTSPKGIVGLIASTVLGGPAGLALNIGGQLAGVPSLSEIGKATMNALGFGGPQAGDLGYTDYSDADIGPMGPQAGDSGVCTFGGYNDFDGTEGTFSTDTSDTGASSGGVDSAGDGGDGYATGGVVRKKYANGSMGINPVASIPSVTNIGEAILDSVGFTRHVADNQLLADAVARGEISPQDYNVLGGYNASQRMGLTPGMTALGTLAYQAFDKTPNVGSAFRNVMGSIFGPMTPNQRNVYDSIMAGDTGVGTFGGYNDFDGTEGTFSTDTSDTGASSGGVDSAGDGGDGYATGGRVFYLQGGLASLLG